MKRIELALLIGVVCSILLTSLGAFGSQAEELRGSVVRLHILANSDSDGDQELKLKVRDALLEETRELFLSSGDLLEAEALALEHLGDFEEIAGRVIRREGYDYPVRARLVNMYFETRQYGELTFPAGRYDAIRLEIGEGKGQNWWCVMFPPLCIPAASEDSDLSLEEQVRELGGQPRYVPRLAVVELLESLQNRLDKDGGDQEVLLLQKETAVPASSEPAPPPGE